MPDPITKNTFYDVIVVGGGPAGASAAYFLTKGGKRVLVLEKERLPRYKTCGGGLSIRFLREQFPFSFEPVLKTSISSVSYVNHNLVSTIPLSPGAIGVVMRDELDEYLLSQAGAEVIQGAAVSSVQQLADRVVVETQDGQQYAGAYLVGADGANSMVARSLGLRPRRLMAAAIEAEISVPPEVMQRFERQLVFIMGEINRGYMWIFPKPDHLTIGIGALHPKPGELQNTLKKVMGRYGISVDGNTRLRGHPIPIYTHRERVSSARTLLVGDAAGLVDPFSGEGIRFAIKSGRLAAESILSGRPQGYSKAVQQAIGLNHCLTLLLSILFYFIPDPFVFLGTPNPFSTQGAVDMLADRMTTTEFIFFSFFTLPIFVGTELIARFLHRLGHARLSDRIRASVYPEDVSEAYRQASPISDLLP
jgi:geranylgeranyl reductase family protein